MTVESISVDEFLEAPDVRALLDPAFLTDLQVKLTWKVPGVSQSSSTSGYTVAALTAVERISTISQGPVRASFRLTFSDGSFGKCRLLREPWLTKRLCWMSRNMSTSRIARMFGCVGRAMLEEWVEGVVLTERRQNAVSRGYLGATLAEIHSIKFRQPYVNPLAEPEAWRQSIRKTCRHAIALGVLPRPDSEGLAEWLQRSVPATIEGGVVHNDFCSENLVVSPRAGLVVVDNETVGFGAFSYDIARTRRREKLSPEQVSDILVGYRTHRSAASYLQHEEFWDVLVGLESTIFHAKYATTEAANEIALLRATVVELLAARRR